MHFLIFFHSLKGKIREASMLSMEVESSGEITVINSHNVSNDGMKPV